MKKTFRTLDAALKAARAAYNDAEAFLVVEKGCNSMFYLYEFVKGAFVLEPSRVFGTWSQYKTHVTNGAIHNVVLIFHPTAADYEFFI